MTDEPRFRPEIAELLNRPYRMVVQGDPDEGFLASAPELPGCFTAGETPREALDLLRDAMALWFETALIRETPIPLPEGDQAGRSGGRILLRLTRSMHRALARRAEAEGVSLNHLAVVLLAEGLGRGAERSDIEKNRAARPSRTGSDGPRAATAAARGRVEAVNGPTAAPKEAKVAGIATAG
jgi:antitoxin HicB